MGKKPAPALDWPAIKAEVHRRGMTLTELAKRTGLPDTACRRVSTVTHYGGQKAIAEFIGYKPEQLWPDRYPKGKPRILDTNKFPPLASQKVGAHADKERAA
ncbi:MAG: helix-turn-helix domain-containing protein [Salipiger marinus]|uniref:helix-turn-helix domain-containing protein n=1 Tax=Salipiger marinus TaxID=555512 RepID=UPI004058F182